jgi:hypothetical protein
VGLIELCYISKGHYSMYLVDKLVRNNFSELLRKAIANTLFLVRSFGVSRA